MITAPPDLTNILHLPYRSSKPRRTGLTVAIDGGMPIGQLRDLAASAGHLIDLWKFGWGTSLVTKDLDAKVEVLQMADIEFYFGGTLFEKFVVNGRLDDYVCFCRQHGCRHVEVSNGTILLSNTEKARYVAELAAQFTVLSEVGYKDPVRSELLSPVEWAQYVRQDFDAGASLVITEARESGRSGICDAEGNLRQDVLDEISGSGADLDHIVFEAPTKQLQTYFIKEFGPNVNLGNVAPGDAIGLETLRLGLRSDTFNLTAEPNSYALFR
jgi:phosphosulfolactate synthase